MNWKQCLCLGLLRGSSEFLCVKCGALVCHTAQPQTVPFKAIYCPAKKPRGQRELEIRGSLEMHVHTWSPVKGLHLLNDEGRGPPLSPEAVGTRASAGGLEDDFCNPLSDLAGGVSEKCWEEVGEEILRMERPCDLGGEGSRSGPACLAFSAPPRFHDSFPIPSRSSSPASPCGAPTRSHRSQPTGCWHSGRSAASLRGPRWVFRSPRAGELRVWVQGTQLAQPAGCRLVWRGGRQGGRFIVVARKLPLSVSSFLY